MWKLCVLVLKALLDPSCPSRITERERNSFVEFWARWHSVYWSFSHLSMHDLLFFFLLPICWLKLCSNMWRILFSLSSSIIETPLTANLLLLPNIYLFSYTSLQIRGSNNSLLEEGKQYPTCPAMLSSAELFNTPHIYFMPLITEAGHTDF